MMSFQVFFRTYLATLLLLIGVLFFVSSKLIFASQPFERDEGEYAYAGSAILDGGIPYRDIYNMKLPGTYYAYALLIALLGRSEAPIRIATMFFGLITAFFTYKIIRLYLDKLKAAAGATFFLLCISTMYNEGLLANSEYFVILFAIPGIFTFLWSLKKNNLLGIFISGLLLGCALIMKQHGIFFLFFSLFLLFFTWIRKANSLHFFYQLVLILIGFSVPLICLIFYLKVHGALNNFFYFTVLYGRAYAQTNSLTQGILNLLSRIADQYFLLLSVISVIWLLFKPSKYSYLALYFFAFSFASVCPGLIFRRHYFILLFPAAGVLFAFVLRSIDIYFPLFSSQIQAWLIGLLILAFMLVFAPQNFLASPDKTYTDEYPNQPFSLMHAASDYLKKLTHPGEKVGMFSNEPEIYYYARCRAASPFLYNYPLLENQKYSMQMTDTFIKQINTTSPNVFLKSNANIMVYNQPALDTIEHWWQCRQNDYEMNAVLAYLDEAKRGKWFQGRALTNDTSWRQSPHMEFYTKKKER